MKKYLRAIAATEPESLNVSGMYYFPDNQNRDFFGYNCNCKIKLPQIKVGLQYLTGLAVLILKLDMSKKAVHVLTDMMLLLRTTLLNIVVNIIYCGIYSYISFFFQKSNELDNIEYLD